MVANIYFRHFGIVFNNLEASINFYQKYFDFKVERAMKESGKYIDHLMNKKNNQINLK